MTRLCLAPELALPIEVVTEKLAFLGRTGSGKTYAAQKLAEEMYRVGAQFVVLDPVGVWYGLRLAADGKDAGLEVPVLGGLHGDIPLETGAGALIANLAVDRGVSMVLDVSQFESDADKARFAQAFADRFFFRKKAVPSAVHLFVEEAQEFVPQNPQREEARMLHAFTRLLKIGRNFGIGGSLISQRPQEVNKKVLNLAELLFAFQMTGPQERKTVQGWIEEKGIDEDIAGELPKLARGEPHVWSPAWLRISKRVVIGTKHTFDASATPTVGKTAAVRPLAPIDLERLRADMAATIEKAKQEDPRALRARIAELEAALRKKGSAPVQEKVARVEVPVLKDAQVKRLEVTLHAAEKLSERTLAALSEMARAASMAMQVLRERRSMPQSVPLPAVPVMSRSVERRLAIQRSARPVPESGDEAVGRGGLRRILTALAQRPQGLTLRQIGVRAGLSSRSGTFSTYLSRARGAGWIVDSGGVARISQEGLAALGEYDPLPSGPALLDHWLRELGDSGAARMLRVLADVYPTTLSLEQLGEKADISSRSGTFSTYLSRLRSLELIEGRGEVRASGELFG